MKSLFTTSHFNFLKMTKKQKDVLFTDISYLGIVLFCSPVDKTTRQTVFFMEAYLFVYIKS